LSDHPLRLEMGERAALYAREYDWQKIAGSVLGLYQDLVREGSADRV
jgi:glycosyltransferase involved in cell wall biosynthesis